MKKSICYQSFRCIVIFIFLFNFALSSNWKVNERIFFQKNSKWCDLEKEKESVFFIKNSNFFQKNLSWIKKDKAWFVKDKIWIDTEKENINESN